MSSSSAAASIEEFIEVLGAEQHVDLPKLRDYARHGVQAAVRGEVWLYLLGVLSDDKSQEMTSVRSKYIEYDSLDKHNLQYEKRIRNEAVRYYQRKLIPRPPPGRTLARSSQRIAMQNNALNRNRLLFRGDGTASSSAGSGGVGGSGGGQIGAHRNGGVVSSSHSNSNGSSSNNNASIIKGIDSNVVFAHGSTALLSSTDPASIAAAATMRGPNRVDNGQTHVLAGIMGDSSSGPTNLLHPSESDEVLLIDPEAAATNEMKRFCLAVENIVCAHLNRWRWRTAVNGIGSTVRQQETHGGEPSAETTQGRQSHGNRPNTPSDAPKSDKHLNTTTGSFLDVPSSVDGSAPLRRTGSMSTSSSASSVCSVEDEEHEVNDVNDGVEHLSSSAAPHSPFPSLPKEYEWAHQSVGDVPDVVSHVVNSGTTNDAPNGHYLRPDYRPDLILLCSPFVKCIRTEAGMFFAFEKLMTIIDEYDEQHPLPSRIAAFLTLFRTTLPDLYAYFDEEEVDVIGLASAWMRHLLAAEMRIEDLMRLWDTYFAVPDPLDLHMYVCIAILTHCKDALEELDQSEAKSMLFTLPPLDVDRIINEAINIRLSHRQSEMLSQAEE